MASVYSNLAKCSVERPDADPKFRPREQTRFGMAHFIDELHNSIEI